MIHDIFLIMKCHKNNCDFFGTATVGEKGQVVIPAEAREKMNLQKGDKLLVFGMGPDMISFSKLEHLEKFTGHLSGKLDAIRKLINKSK